MSIFRFPQIIKPFFHRLKKSKKQKTKPTTAKQKKLLEEAARRLAEIFIAEIERKKQYSLKDKNIKQ